MKTVAIVNNHEITRSEQTKWGCRNGSRIATRQSKKVTYRVWGGKGYTKDFLRLKDAKEYALTF